MPRSIPYLLAVLLFSPGLALAADEIHWTFTSPTSVTFDWRGSESSIRYGLTSSYGHTVTAQTPSPLPFSSSGPYWEAKITGLTAGTTYHYSIGTSPDHTFHTIPTAPTSFTVYVEADIGDSTSYPRVCPVQKLIRDGHPDFVFPIGDLTLGNPHGQATVDIAFNNEMYWSLDAADMAIWGNHEWDTPSYDDLRNYKGRFDFPHPQTSPGAPSGGCCGEDWYWFDYGNVRFIGYPEPYTSAAWSDWYPKARALMDSAQANPAIRFIVTFGHRPAYSSAHHPGDGTLKGYLDALGDSHNKYVLNLNGHSHNYERSYPQHGVTHVTCGGGGATLEQESGSCPYLGGCPPPSWSAFRAFHHGPVRLSFTSSSIKIEFICGPAGDSGSNKNDITCTSGTIVDSYTITSSAADVDPTPQVAVGFALRAVRPNPTSGLPTVSYSLPSAEPASLQLVDVAGRVLLTQDLGSPGAGAHQVRLGPGNAPSPGVYWLRLSQAGRSVTTTVVFTR